MKPYTKVPYKTKNANRRIGRQNARIEGTSRATLRKAKSLRRQFGGAFGKAPVALHNFLILGTTGAMKWEDEVVETP